MIDLGSQKSPHYAQKLKMTQSYLELEGKMYSSCRNWPFQPLNCNYQQHKSQKRNLWLKSLVSFDKSSGVKGLNNLVSDGVYNSGKSFHATSCINALCCFKRNMFENVRSFSIDSLIPEKIKPTSCSTQIILLEVPDPRFHTKIRNGTDSNQGHLDWLSVFCLSFFFIKTFFKEIEQDCYNICGFWQGYWVGNKEGG